MLPRAHLLRAFSPMSLCFAMLACQAAPSDDAEVSPARQELLAQKSLYVTADSREGSPIQAYAILPAPRYLEYQAISSPMGKGGVGLALDSATETLFLTFEGKNYIRVVDARTLKAPPVDVLAPGAHNLAGIVADQEHHRLYAIDRGTNRLYSYSWKGGELKLHGLVSLEGVASGRGLALDETNDLLYVADLTHGVKVFHTSDWSAAGAVHVPSHAPMAVAVNDARGFLYTGNAFGPTAKGAYGCTGLVSRFDLRTGVETTFDLQTFTGAAGDCVVSLAVDQDTGLVYVTTGRAATGGTSELMVLDSDLKFLDRIGGIGSPTGLVVPRTAVAYNPLSLQTEVRLPSAGCVSPGDTLTYSIAFANDDRHLVSGVVVTEALPAEVGFVSASRGGKLSRGVVTWDVGRLPRESSGFVTLTVQVNDSAVPGATLEGEVSIDSNQTGPAYARAPVNICRNQAPVADARPDGAVLECGSPAGAVVRLDGMASYDPDGEDVLSYQWRTDARLDDPMAPTAVGTFSLGDHLATLTVSDGELEARDTATFRIVDTMPPSVQCNARDIVPQAAPVTFRAAARDVCGGEKAVITGYDCWAINEDKRRIDRKDACVVSFAGDQMTVLDSGGAGTNIEWYVVATDGGRNTTARTCSIHVDPPSYRSQPVDVTHREVPRLPDGAR